MEHDTSTDGDRRKSIAAVAAAVIIVGGALTFAVAAVPNTAEASVQVNDFDLPDAQHEAESVDEELRILIWGLGVEWSDLPQPPEEAEVVVYVESAGGEMERHGSFACSEGDPTTGECRWVDDDATGASIEQYHIDLLSSGWSAQQFSPDPGEAVSHTIDVRIEAAVQWDGGSVSAADTASTTITIEHPEEEAAGTEEGTPDAEEEAADPGASIKNDAVEIYVDGEYAN